MTEQRSREVDGGMDEVANEPWELVTDLDAPGYDRGPEDSALHLVPTTAPVTEARATEDGRGSDPGPFDRPDESSFLDDEQPDRPVRMLRPVEDLEEDLVSLLERQHLRFADDGSDAAVARMPARGPRLHPSTGVPAMPVAEASALLRDERLRLTRAAKAAEVGVGDADQRDQETSLDTHLAESATETYEREVASSIAEGLRLELDELDAADERLTAGTYGRCERCGDPIPVERLRAEPATRWCLVDAVEVSDDRRR